jgi:hypothetical protein
MLSLIAEFLDTAYSLPEPLLMLLVGVLLLTISIGLRRVAVSSASGRSPIIRRRILSATRLTPQRGHS